MYGCFQWCCEVREVGFDGVPYVGGVLGSVLSGPLKAECGESVTSINVNNVVAECAMPDRHALEKEVHKL